MQVRLLHPVAIDRTSHRRISAEPALITSCHQANKRKIGGWLLGRDCSKGLPGLACSSVSADAAS